MRYKATFVIGFAAGYTLGAKAGRERYEQIRRTVRGLSENPTVQSAAGVSIVNLSTFSGGAFIENMAVQDPTAGGNPRRLGEKSLKERAAEAAATADLDDIVD